MAVPSCRAAPTAPLATGRVKASSNTQMLLKIESVVDWFSPPWFLAQELILPSALALKRFGCCETWLGASLPLQGEQSAEMLWVAQLSPKQYSGWGVLSSKKKEACVALKRFC